MTTHETLVKARALIEDPRDWIRRDWSNGYGGYCAAGAIEAIGGATAPDKLPRNAKTTPA